MEFCKCGSLMITGACSNKRCPFHNKEVTYATHRQIDNIKDMMDRLHIDEDKFALQSLNDRQAAVLIKELKKMMKTNELS